MKSKQEVCMNARSIFMPYKKMEVTVKILRIVLYIAAFASFYSLSHAVNIRYCIKNVSNDSVLMSIEHTLNTFTVKELI